MFLVKKKKLSLKNFKTIKLCQNTFSKKFIETLTWRTTTSKPGGPVGQPLTIDCGANGVNDQDIKILDHKGRAIDEATNGDVVVAGPDVTIPKLGREHHGMKVRK
jgi:hypothetical protein